MTGSIDLPLDIGPADGFRVHLHWVSKRFPTVEDQVAGFYRIWYGQHQNGVGYLRNLRLSSGRLPDAYPASYAHVWVGANLGWCDKLKYPDGKPVGEIAGYGPHWFGIYAGEPWTMRGCWADDRRCETVIALADNTLHEVGHMFVGDADHWHKIINTPAAIPAQQETVDRAKVWADRLNLTGAA